MWARATEAGRRREDQRALLRFVAGLELGNDGDRCLVHVAADHEIDTGVDERAQDLATPAERSLARGAPGRPGEVMVESHDAEGAVGRLAHASQHPRESGLAHCAALLPPWPNGVEPGNEEIGVDELRLGWSDDAFPRGERRREARREGVRDVVIPRNGEQRQLESLETLRRPLELGSSSAVRKIAGCEDERGGESSRELAERCERLLRLTSPDVEVGDVENSRGHGRGRLYTRIVADESPELFDDIYLGLRAGGAVRKQRRGEPLSAEEEEAIGRWHRLSLGRKFIAIGAFAIGTFGLGFTVGGLIFGRWRTARR